MGVLYEKNDDGKKEFQVARFIGALIVFLLLVGGGIWADVNGYAASSGALFGFAGTIFGVVVAFLSVEGGSGGN